MPVLSACHLTLEAPASMQLRNAASTDEPASGINMHVKSGIFVCAKPSLNLGHLASYVYALEQSPDGCHLGISTV